MKYMSHTITKYILIAASLLSSTNSYAGIDYSRYENVPPLFLGWETSFYFALASIILFLISSILTKRNTDEHGNVNGWYLIPLNIAMIICAICSAYLLFPLAIIYILFRDKKKKNT